MGGRDMSKISKSIGSPFCEVHHALICVVSGPERLQVHESKMYASGQ